MVALRRGVQTIVGRQNLIFDYMWEGLFGQDPGTGRPTPFPGVTGKTEETKNLKAISIPEYVGTKLPIPVANYVQEFYDEATSHGMPRDTAQEWIKLFVAPTIEGVTSYHMSPVHEAPPEKPASRSRGNVRSARGSRGTGR